MDGWGAERKKDRKGTEGREKEGVGEGRRGEEGGSREGVRREGEKGGRV